jgi:hypothetical protein
LLLEVFVANFVSSSESLENGTLFIYEIIRVLV